MKRLFTMMVCLFVIGATAAVAQSTNSQAGKDAGAQNAIHPLDETAREHFRKAVSRDQQVDTLRGHPATRHLVDPGKSASAAVTQQWQNGIRLSPLAPSHAPGPGRGRESDVALKLRDISVGPNHPAPGPSQNPPTAYIVGEAIEHRSPQAAPISVTIANPPKAGKYAVTFALRTSHAPDAVAYRETGGTDRQLGQSLKLVPDGTASGATHWSTGLHIHSANQSVTLCLFPPQSAVDSGYEMVAGPVVVRLL